jgi:hypothetical protein
MTSDVTIKNGRRVGRGVWKGFNAGKSVARVVSTGNHARINKANTERKWCFPQLADSDVTWWLLPGVDMQ